MTQADTKLLDFFTPVSLSVTGVATGVVFSVEGEYYGKFLHSGWGEGAVHALIGDIYASDAQTLQIIGFTFDGNAPGAVFLLGTDKSYSQVQGGGNGDPTAVAVQNPEGTFEGLPVYENENLLLSLPEGTVLSDYSYISVWCRNFSVYFGGFDIPEGFDYPQPQMIGQFSQLAHQVSSGQVTILDEKTIKIEQFTYDGQGPDAFFYVGVGDAVGDEAAPYGKIPDENDSLEVLGRYSGKDIVLTLPENLSFRNIKWISVWCIAFAMDFGNVFLTDVQNIPPSLNEKEKMNCEPLSDNLQVSWLIDGQDIKFELAGNIDRETDYMAFGLSGNEESFAMIGSDVTVVDYKTNESPRAIDYHITAYSQCSTNGGTCRDTSASNGGTDNANMPEGEITNGIVRVRYSRPLITADSQNDKEYKTDGTAQQIVWAIGPLNTNGDTAKHYTGGRISSPKAINFGRTVADNCPRLVNEVKEKAPAFKPHHLYGREGAIFTAEIGQAASEQGYKALTGRPSWGIAWYVNGILIPELHLQRGVSYTFRVAGGTDPNLGAMYHPFYFTNDVEGGLQQTQNPSEIIYPGTIDGESAEFAVGEYCEWILTDEAIRAAEDGKQYQCFEEFKQDLVLSCNNNPNQYSEFIWTPDADTPDLLYYQCYTHKSLGWKVHVYDELPETEIATETCGQGTERQFSPEALKILLKGAKGVVDEL
ncbi:protein Skeletor, isoforms B/C-like [Watersipora subatra]|uniref:protein Skeletor, isoforms B/C-like n=1 Tax=Watersipora subatra TaxID=2589382 RepID=UPI00355ADBB5